MTTIVEKTSYNELLLLIYTINEILDLPNETIDTYAHIYNSLDGDSYFTLIDDDFLYLLTDDEMTEAVFDVPEGYETEEDELIYIEETPDEVFSVFVGAVGRTFVDQDDNVIVFKTGEVSIYDEFRQLLTGSGDSIVDNEGNFLIA